MRSLATQVKPYSPWQFAFFRIALGLYLVQHFALLVPWGPDIFGRDGTLGDPALNFTHGLLPNPLAHLDSDGAVTAFLVVMLVLSVSLVLGTWYFRFGLRRFRRTEAPLFLVFHLTDLADPLPAEHLPNRRARLFTLSHRPLARKRAACAEVLEHVRAGYRLTTTDAIVPPR